MSFLSSIPLYMRNNHGITQYKKINMPFRKSATSKVEVSLTIDNLPLKVFGSKDKVLSRILQDSRHLSKNGKDFIEIKSYLIPTTSIHVVQNTETGPQLSSM